MADDGGGTGDQRRPGGGTGIAGEDKHRKRPFKCVEKQCRRRQTLVAGPQDVGCADVAGADAADIAEPGKAGEQQAERDRAGEVAGQGGDERGVERIAHGTPQSSRAKTQRPSMTVIMTRPCTGRYSNGVFFDLE